MQFWLLMLVLFATVALGALICPLYMPLPLLFWLLIQTLLYHRRERDDD